MKDQAGAETQRDVLDRKLTELTLLAKRLCPEAKVEANTIQYEEGRLKVFSPPEYQRWKKTAGSALAARDMLTPRRTTSRALKKLNPVASNPSKHWER